MLLLAAVPWDLLHVCAELLTGKSVPLLMAIALLPVGQALAWSMVSLGAVAGALFSVYATRQVAGLSLVGGANRLLQLGFSLVASLALLLSLAGGVHASRGPALALIPAFCVAAQTVPQRHSTALVALVLSALAFYACILAEATASRAAAEPDEEAVLLLSLADVVRRALQLFALAFYASVQHAPTQTYFDLRGAEPVHASHFLARHTPYALFVHLVAAWLRACVWSGVCFMRDSQLHAMLEGRPAAAAWPCLVAYMVALLFSACWTATQLREQVLPLFALDSEPDRVKALACAAAAAALCRPGPAYFYVASALAAASVLTAALAHIHHHHAAQ